MSIQQAEGWYLWEKLMVTPRQALKRTVESVPRRDRLASVLVLLLTATGLLVTPTFGGSCEEIRDYGKHRFLEGLKRMVECSSGERLFQPGATIRKCQKEAYDIAMEGLKYTLESCGAIEEPPKAPAPVSCPDEYPVATPTGDCVLQPPKPEQLVSCPEDPEIAIAKEIAEGLVVRFGIEGAKEYVHQRTDGKRGEKITFVEANLLLSAIKAIEMEETSATRGITEIGGTPVIGTKRQILRRKAQAEAAACLEIGKFRTKSGFAASGFSQIAEWFGGDKATQNLLGERWRPPRAGWGGLV